MTGRIITVRHGMPDQDRNVRISAREYGEWWAGYDRSGLVPGQTPPEALIDLAAQAETIFSSTLPRAIETAALLTGGGREVPQDVIFVEAPLPPPPVPFLRLRPGTWGVISRSFWVSGFAPDGIENNSASWRRVDEVASRLIAASQSGDVMLCAHGYLNWMLDRRMKKLGWVKTSHVGRNHYFSWRVYSSKGAIETDHSPSEKLAAE
ncbi:MAG: histidine phosphatase family protein [Pseudomonadota bacterium]